MSFIISEKTSNPRVRKSLVAVYEIGEFEGEFTIDFWGEDAQFLEMWSYDSEDERDRVFKRVDNMFGDPNMPGMSQRC